MSIDEPLLRAAKRIVLRHEEPDWHPTDAELDAWGRGYFVGHRQGYADAYSQPETRIDCEWPPVAEPGSGGQS